MEISCKGAENTAISGSGGAKSTAFPLDCVVSSMLSVHVNFTDSAAHEEFWNPFGHKVVHSGEMANVPILNVFIHSLAFIHTCWDCLTRCIVRNVQMGRNTDGVIEHHLSIL